jgi:hypothetical protein
VALLQLLAKAHVESAQHKKRQNSTDKEEVVHKISLTMNEIRAAALIKLRLKCVKKSLMPEKSL